MYTLCFLFTIVIFGMERDESHPAYHSVIVPGQNGLGGESFHNNGIINTTYSAYDTPTSLWQIDLGQENCIKHFENAMAKDSDLQQNKHTKLIVCGISQGSATVVNWLGKLPVREQEEKVACVVLEAVLGTGNSAINHTVTTFKPWTKSIPFGSYILPGLAKCVFPTYNPFGTQALYSAKNISPKIPVIIMHNATDPQLSVNDARKLYCTLRESGHKEVYYLEIQSEQRAHINVLDFDPDKVRKIAALQKIYKKNNLPYKEYQQDVNLAEFQPEIVHMQRTIANSW